LATLPEEQRKTLEMAYFQGYTQAEIAEAMGVPIGTVKGRTRLALDKMRVNLESKGIRSAT
jgi:RNA polymerase sigma-70 factor (ECF subfamily)